MDRCHPNLESSMALDGLSQAGFVGFVCLLGTIGTDHRRVCSCGFHGEIPGMPGELHMAGLWKPACWGRPPRRWHVYSLYC